MEILYKSGDVHKAIKKIFSLPCKRRVAVVAYLGVNAENYLPNPKGIEIICCPEPGATSPDAVRKLLNRGAIVRFSEGLHSKVYWSNRGCIITSANISHRALGSSPQKEVGVLINSDDFNIDRLIHESNPFNITQALMDKLEKQDRRLKKTIGIKTNNTKQTQFNDWYSSPYREPWKLGWYTESDFGTAQTAKDKSMKEYNVSAPHDFLNVAQKQASTDDWFLCFEITKNGIKGIAWMYVDFVVSVDSTDETAYESDYPFQAVQVHKLSHYPPPPFFISKEFKKALKKAVKEYGVEKIENSSTLKASRKLIDLTEKYINVQASV